MTYLDIHILQSVPPSNINRDDTGSPKSAVYGGVRRARVSSQAWKRATRKRFNLTLDISDIGHRTKRVADLLGEYIVVLDPTIGKVEADKMGSAALKAAGIKLSTPKPSKNSPKDAPPSPDESGYLLFLSAGQYQALAELSVAARTAEGTVEGKAAKAAVQQGHSIDVALFGRMVADDAELNVDAAAQVAHAISVQAVEQEFDYFTAVDDAQERDQESGAAMIGTVEFNSSTLYRYANVNIPGLRKNLGDTAATARATAAFVESLALSMPTGKQNTFANRTVPDAIVVSVREDQPINLVGAFENAVSRTQSSSVIEQSATQLAGRYNDIAQAYSAPSRTWVVAVGDASKPLGTLGKQVSMAQLIIEIEQEVQSRIGESN
ncbi:type I-E CRISPR-associated protein Cas7/Cse4/CasC [Rhodococcus sp. 1168]|uniref:type I-E CRISPR-associated protein Cas7/Cse4/CasC n=1 Tax=Rhodococcus sp. 1168 TaxID=2018041 RepID=UPI000A0D1D7C|nr:type I-E CRISPR-associated protein Cas7/Cse4/CasC [Rhodococcus sp. 1168]ORI24088.1 type I-E CRISPR-associated protein Cas7/Cse4/CasC [Rhodococcus sp. 1168]